MKMAQDSSPKKPPTKESQSGLNLIEKGKKITSQGPILQPWPKALSTRGPSSNLKKEVAAKPITRGGLGSSDDPFFSADSDLDSLDMDKMDLDKESPLGLTYYSSTPIYPVSLGPKSPKKKKPLEIILKERKQRKISRGRKAFNSCWLGNFGGSSKPRHVMKSKKRPGFTQVNNICTI